MRGTVHIDLRVTLVQRRVLRIAQLIMVVPPLGRQSDARSFACRIRLPPCRTGSDARGRVQAQKETPLESRERRGMVEAAGQLIHLFRDGPDYAFILRTGCGACYSPDLADES